MRQLASRPWATTAVALAGAGVIAAAPVVTPPLSAPDLSVASLRLLAGETADITNITIDFIRHGESLDNVANLVGTIPPGAALTAAGREQAEALVSGLKDSGIHDAQQVFASEFLRTQQTAWPLLESLGAEGSWSDPSEAFAAGHILSGLNEINAGVLDKGSLLGSLMQPLGRLNEILYILPPFLWTLGFPIVPEWGSTINFNGVVFNDNFSGAVGTIFENALAGDSSEAAAFSHAAAIMAWTQMNVNNPNPLLMFTDPLGNTGQVVVNGSPGDWTLQMWNGDPVAAANLWQDLFVNTRDLMVAPQAAITHVVEALFGQGPFAGNIFGALEDGVTDIARTTLGYPGAMISDIIDALQGNLMEELGIDALMGMLGGLGGGDLLPVGDLAALLPGAGGDVAALLSGDLIAALASSLAL